MSDELRLREFATRYASAWCSGNPAAVAEFFATDGSLTINGGTSAVGRAAIADAARAFMAAFPDMRVFFDRLVLRGERVEFHWTLEGHNTGPGGTGKRVRISGFEDWKIGSDGLVADSQGHFDADEYQRQIEFGVGDN
jgi:predicted ester cyclase